MLRGFPQCFQAWLLERAEASTKYSSGRRHWGERCEHGFGLGSVGSKSDSNSVHWQELGLQQIKLFLGQYGIDCSHVKNNDKTSVTTALEFQIGKEKRNVMLRELGGLSDFGPSDLSESDYELIEDADYVCLFNWAGTRKFGTELAEIVFSRTKMRGKGKTYFDTADPTPNRTQIPELMENVLKKQIVDILSLNENEAVSYGNHIRRRNK
jgi:sugar/nucleoside kinase (ribokinase family)